MKAPNKYNLGQTVYFLEDNQVANRVITVIQKCGEYIYYGFEADDDAATTHEEGLVFPTKASLLASL